MLPNKHDWSEMFSGNICRLCGWPIQTGTGKANHMMSHERAGKAKRIGDGTKTNPYRYVVVNGSND